MTDSSYPSLLSLPQGRGLHVDPQVKWMLAASLVFHFCAIVLGSGLRFSPSMERPLASYQVSLVSMQSLAPKAAPPASSPVEPPPPAQPVEEPKQPLHPVAVQKEVPKTAPNRVRPTAPAVAPVPAGRPTENLMRDALRGIELPPQAPTLGALKPVPPMSPARRDDSSKRDIDALLGQLKVPTEPMPTKASPEKVPESRPRRSLSEDIAKQLQNIQPPPLLESRSTASRPAPSATPTELKKPDTTIRVTGNASGTNPYLAAVQNKISRHWIAPQVDLTGRSLQVVIKFRLHRSGSVSDVLIEKSSGNGYYDDAGRRAVFAAAPLPPFPSDMSDPYLETHFSFTVGEEAG
ncbi:MAG: TonB family protein [Nitrospirae bacterium]|nr:TonB family protein [Nitrospirota bacterium]